MTIYGSIQNKHQVSDRVQGDAAAGEDLEIGLVYQDGNNGWKNAPTDGSVPASRLYWNDRVINNSGDNAAKGDKGGTFYGTGSQMLGKADGIITVGQKCRASETNGHGGQLQGLTVRGDSSANLAEDLAKIIAIYKGHANETVETNNDPTSAADGDENLIFEIVRGN